MELDPDLSTAPEADVEPIAPPSTDRSLAFPWKAIVAIALTLVAYEWFFRAPTAPGRATNAPRIRTEAWNEVAHLDAPIAALRLHDDRLWAAGPEGLLAWAPADAPTRWTTVTVVIPEDFVPPGATEPDVPPTAVIDNFTSIAFPESGGVYVAGGFEDSPDSSIIVTGEHGGWERPSLLDAGSIAGIEIVGTRAYAIGPLGVAASSDSGRTWTTLTPTRCALSALDVAPSGHLCAVGDEGTILQTSDGSTWSTTSLGDHTCSGVAFIDDEHGFVTSLDGTLFETTDGGSTWTHVELPLDGSEPSPLYAIAHGAASDSSATQLLAIGSGAGQLFLSKDGSTWVSTQIPENNTPGDVTAIAVGAHTVYAGTSHGQVFALRF